MFITYDAAERPLQRLVPPFTSRGWISTTLDAIEPVLLVDYVAEIGGGEVLRCAFSNANLPQFAPRRNIIGLTLLVPGRRTTSAEWHSSSVLRIFASESSEHIKYEMRSGHSYIVPGRPSPEIPIDDWIPSYQEDDFYVVPSEASPILDDKNWACIYEIDTGNEQC